MEGETRGQNEYIYKEGQCVVWHGGQPSWLDYYGGALTKEERSRESLEGHTRTDQKEACWVDWKATGGA